MKSVVLPGLLGGIISFVFFTASDIIFYKAKSMPPGIKPLENQGKQLLIFLTLMLIHAIIISTFYFLFQGGFSAHYALKGLLFGLFCGLVLARPNVEGIILFKVEFIPRLFMAYWALEFIIGYSILGTLIGIFHNTFTK